MEDEVLVTDTESQTGDENTETTQTVEELQAQLEAERQAKEDYAKKFEDQKKRAEKAEGKFKNPSKDKPEILTTSNSVSTEDVFLIASERITQEEYMYAKKIAQLEDIPLDKAVKSDLFTSWREKKERELKAQEAAMRSTKGGSSAQEQKTFSTPGLSDEEHRKMFLARRNK